MTYDNIYIESSEYPLSTYHVGGKVMQFMSFDKIYFFPIAIWIVVAILGIYELICLEDMVMIWVAEMASVALLSTLLVFMFNEQRDMNKTLTRIEVLLEKK